MNFPIFLREPSAFARPLARFVFLATLTLGLCLISALSALADHPHPEVMQLASEPMPLAVDLGSTLISILDLISNAVLWVVGGVVSWVLIRVRPFLQNFLSAAVIDKAGSKIKEGALRIVQDVLGELRQRAAGGAFRVEIGSPGFTRAVQYVLDQFPIMLRLAGMDKAAVERLIAAMFGQEVAKIEGAVLTDAGAAATVAASTAAAAVVATAPAVAVVEQAIRNAVADPTVPLTITR